MNNRCSTLKLYLRMVGTAGLIAFPCGLLPATWMDATHRWLGMGDLPTEPIVGYLARSTSFLYALLGGLLWLLSSDVARYRPIILFVGWAMIIMGIMVVSMDYLEGMPWWWVMIEGPSDALLGTIMVWMARAIAAVKPYVVAD
jgi:hypothetical protein